ncbi:WXG100 family type VII secretion target [Micromonospora sp. NBC_01813]|uniref:WXG100 family type VII secretion target n=1 Tax=Micromonospora sp. NBC_01813 TaxID=2975988 RepID=UPI002DD971D8|nr:WXG100 family type VII secretion target [Micromonospora sp. NBC_01813]WSA07153.1 WXG100 family type VII secretion target [Micromonospora sp. NBC_01813]
MSIDSSFLRVTTEQEGAGSYVLSRSAEMEERLAQLKAQLAELESVWSGEAREHYFELRNQWSVAAEDLFGPTGILGMVGNALNTCWDNYTGAEDSNNLTWRSS